MTKKILTLFLFCLVIGFSLHSCKSTPPADLIIMNAKVWTGSDSVFSEAICILDNKIIFVGTSDEAMKLSSSTTQVVDAKVKLVIPGFNDAHIHFLGGSIGLSEVELSSASSLDEIHKRINDFAAKNAALPWITGRGWQYTLFPGGMPTKEFLDTLDIDRPIFLDAYDGHSALANSHALQLAGVTAKLTFTGFGEIIRDERGVPTGAFTEHAQSLVSKIIPPLSRDDELNALRKGMKVAASLGITSIQNASGSIDEFSLYEELYGNEELTLRTSTAFSVNEATKDDDIEFFRKTRDRIQKNHMISAGAVKFMLDGVIESHTAAMLDPYSDAEGKGSLSMPVERYRQLVLSFDKAGFQIYTHAIGDLAVREAVNAYEFALQINKTTSARHRVEHIEMVSSEDVPRFGKLGILPSMEPIHAEPATISVWAKAVGENRLPNSFAWASFLKNNAQLVFSSDWPACVSLDPIYGLHVAVTRCTPGGLPSGGWVPEQKISIQDALTAYTISGAYASFEEDVKGKIAPGYLADIVILSQDLFTIDPLETHKTKVVLTIFDGKIVYRDESLMK